MKGTARTETTLSLIWGERRGGGGPFEACSPLDGSVLAAGELLGAFDCLEGRDLPPALDFADVCGQLYAGLASIRPALVEALRKETGFVPVDCEELIDGALFYAKGYAEHPSTRLTSPSEGFVGGARRMTLVRVPYGTVAVILPHNAFLSLALACMLNALRAGNRVILRAPLQSARSASLLSAVLEKIPIVSRFASVAICSAAPFVDWFLATRQPGLLHFFGSSRRAGDMVSRGFDAGKSVVVDGEGNVWVYVDRDVSAEAASEMLMRGAFRYNGQTCTSINGAIVHPDRFAEVCALTTSRAKSLRVGAAAGDEVGPVFNERQAEWCLSRIESSGGEILAGGSRRGSYVTPTVVRNPDAESELVREGIFGPALWIAPGDEDAFTSLWDTNLYPLCASVLQEPARPEAWAARLPGLARLVMNGDPSIEDPFEYWGGYPPAGQNAVSLWPSKYLRTLQIDRTA